MTKAQAIPAYANVSDGTLVGTAFLASVSGRPFIVTGAHVPVGAHPTSDWSTYAEHLRLVAAGGKVELDLFDGGSEREPRFGYLPGTNGQIGDLLWWSLDGHRSELNILQAEYVTHVVPSSFSVQPAVTAYGYPGSVASWPEARTVVGTLTGFESDEILNAVLPTTPGFSGCPVLDRNNTLVGMVIGRDAGLAQIVPSNVLHAVIDAWNPPSRQGVSG